jgi:hypothetical protein
MGQSWALEAVVWFKVEKAIPPHAAWAVIPQTRVWHPVPHESVHLLNASHADTAQVDWAGVLIAFTCLLEEREHVSAVLGVGDDATGPLLDTGATEPQAL